MSISSPTDHTSDVQPIQWTDGRLRLLDQSKLPLQYVVLDIYNHRQAVDAIKEMRVRGAPAIGVTAAYAVALAAQEFSGDDHRTFLHSLEQDAQAIVEARPTAVNLRWAVGRMLAVARSATSITSAQQSLVDEAVQIHREDVETNQAIGRHGVCLLPKSGGVLTHCNAGALATGGYGTALGVIRSAWEEGKHFHVFVTETRPFLQGARLTTWELKHLGIPTTLIVDAAAGAIMSNGEVQCVIVGADRIAANGDVANKIGTYTIAVLARANGIPFYVASPTSTVDMCLESGETIPIEERHPKEITHWRDVQTVPDGIGVRNPAFDVTPHDYVSAIITQHGVARAPYKTALKKMVGNG